jgi:homogentisate 1,2-dioxygenase
MEVLLRTTIGNRRFHGHASLSYHVHRPTQVKIIKIYSVEPKIAVGKNIKSLLLKGFELKPADDFLEAAKLCLSIKIVPLVLQRQRNL